MAQLIPFNWKNNNVARSTTNAGFENFYNMLDDFFSDGMAPSRSLVRDTFKIDIEEAEKEYLITAELPGVKKEEIDLGIDGDNLCISVNRAAETSNEGKNYIHRERRAASMSRRIRLAEVNLNEITAKLEDGVLAVTVPKTEKEDGVRKINIE